MAHTNGEDRDGTVALIEGQVIVVDPKGEGRFPTIAPGEGVEVWVGDRRIEGPTVVTSADTVRVVPKSRPGKREIKVELSRDKLTATVRVTYDPGERYSLPSIPPTTAMVVEGIRESQSSPITPAEVKEELARHRVFVGIDEQAIQEAIDRGDGTPVVVAVGTPPGESKDAWVEYLFSTEERVVLPSEDEERVDFRERVQIPSVAPGTVIARKHPPQLGSPGLAVTGEVINPRVPRDVTIKAGQGVRVTPDGREAIATIGGRPVVEGKKLLKVLPVLVQQGNVDLSTGNITFHGDVEIRGHVMENMRVKAAGTITVFRSASHAHLEADGSITIHGNLIGGSARAGGLAAFYRQLAPSLEELQRKLEQVDLALQQLLQFSQARAHVEKKGCGPLLQILLEQKFPEVFVLAEKIYELTRRERDLPQKNRELAAALQQSLRGVNVQRLEREELQAFCRELAQWLEEVQAQVSRPADISLYYAQNARIEATGWVRVRGQGSYHSNIVAGQGVVVDGTPGIVRGGVIQSFGDVYIKEAGSPTNTSTVICCSQDARLELDLVYPNVIIQVGAMRHRFDTLTRGVRARLEKGELKLY